jgi:hypothetical protein
MLYLSFTKFLSIYKEEIKTTLTTISCAISLCFDVCELGYEDQTVNDLNTLAGVDATGLAGRRLRHNCEDKCRKYRKPK